MPFDPYEVGTFREIIPPYYDVGIVVFYGYNMQSSNSITQAQDAPGFWNQPGAMHLRSENDDQSIRKTLNIDTHDETQ